MIAKVTLEINFDHANSSSPDSWDWMDLLDLNPVTESVEIVDYSEEEDGSSKEDDS
jgi:hypothetical protein